MRTQFDSEADALSIDLVDAHHWDSADTIDDDYCTVAFAEGKPANVELLSPAQHLDLLETVADRHRLDSEALQAAAQSALAAPDRAVTIDVHTLA